MKSSRIAAGGLALLLAAAVWDARNPGALSFRALPAAAVVATFLTVATASAPRRRRASRALLAFSPLLLLSAVYVLNPTHRLYDGTVLLPVASIRGLPGSAHAPASRAAFGVVVAAAAVFAMGRSLSPRAARLALGAAAGLGGAVAALALHQRLAPRPFPVYDFTGVFVSPNHFAAFANLALPLALAAGRRFQLEAARQGRLSSPAPFCYLVAALVAAAVVWSGSRAGILLAAVSLAAAAGWELRLRRDYGHWRPARWIRVGVPAAAVTAAAAIAVVAAAALGGGAGRGLAFAPEEFRFRARVLHDTLAIWRDNPWWGTGPGTFSTVYPFYQSPELIGRGFRHAHCDPLQWLAEFGALGLAVAAVSIAAALWLAARDRSADREESPPSRELEAPACALALGTVALHALVDFPFRAPAIALLAALCASRVFVPSAARAADGASVASTPPSV